MPQEIKLIEKIKTSFIKYCNMIRYIWIGMRNINVKVGTNNEGYESCMNQQGIGERN